jgi:hypothetical protein
MIKNLNIFVLLLLSINCKAQSPIIDIIDDDGSEVIGAYYKDVNNLLNPFEGTYIYTSGSTTLKIVLVKKVLQYNSQYYEDLIIGEYQYIENGIEKINTLNEINNVYIEQRFHKIDSNFLVNNNFKLFPCLDCFTNEKRLYASILDPSTNSYADIVIRKTIINGQEALKINIINFKKGLIIVNELATEPNFSLPLEEYILIKQ